MVILLQNKTETLTWNGEWIVGDKLGCLRLTMLCMAEEDVVRLPGLITENNGLYFSKLGNEVDGVVIGEGNMVKQGQVEDFIELRSIKALKVWSLAQFTELLDSTDQEPTSLETPNSGLPLFGLSFYVPDNEDNVTLRTAILEMGKSSN